MMNAKPSALSAHSSADAEYTLFFAPCTASLSVHWFLIELESALGVKHTRTLVDFSTRAQKSPEYLALNPKGRVPALAIRSTGTTIGESAAILLYLAGEHPGFAPLPHQKEYPAYLEMTIYIANTTLPAMRDWFYADKDGEAAGALSVRKIAKTRILESFALWDRALQDNKEYLLGGKEPCMVDFFAASTVAWSPWVEDTASGYPNVKKWVDRLRSRKSWGELREREGEWTFSSTEWQYQV